MDFCLKMYREICRALKDLNVVTVEQYLLGNNETPFVILRHDVDREMGNALAMAELEHKLGLNSTYYFRYPRTFNIPTISRIQSLGHEVGYHYEVLDKAGGNPVKAIDIFCQELDIFREHFQIKTVCMHGNPLTPWDGRSIWKSKNFSDFGLLGEAYISCKNPLVYLTDTGRNWSGIHNVKDSLESSNIAVRIHNTRHLIELLNEHFFETLYLNCHPERWGPGIWGWARAYARDNAYNLTKAFLGLLR